MKTLRIFLLIIAVSLLGLLGWRSIDQRRRAVAALQPPAAGPGSPVSGRAPAPPAPSPDQNIAEIPEYAEFYLKLRTTFPRDYDAFRADVGRIKPTPTPDAAIWDAMRDLQQSRGVLAAQADAAALDRYFDARSAMVDGLSPLSPRLCADFLYGETGASIAEFTASHRGLVATLADRQLAAITDGLSQHRERAPPTDADLDALVAALAAQGLSQPEVGLLIDGQAPDPPLQDTRLCEIGQRYLDALRGLPADARHRIYGLAAELLARS